MKLQRRVGHLVCIALFLTRFAAAQTPGEDDARQKAALYCAACHGEAGNGMLPANPILAGQLPEALYKQLNDFYPLDGKPIARNNNIMSGMSAVLPDEDRRALSAYFSRQKALPPPVPAGDGRLATGRILWRRGDFGKAIPACTGCHGPTGLGLPSQNPRLAGQHAEYTAAQLANYRNETRANDQNKVMRMISERLADKQIDALAAYIASLP